MNDGAWRWTQERVELLKELNALGVGYLAIAKRLGGGITKNAVCGKANRLGLTGAQPAKSGRAKRKVKPWRHLQVFGLVDKNSPKALKADGYVPPAEDPIPLHQRKTIATLEDDSCRWPVGDPQLPEFHFCGAEKVPGLSYCRPHARRAHKPAETRRTVFVPGVFSKETENV